VTTIKLAALAAATALTVAAPTAAVGKKPSPKKSPSAKKAPDKKAPSKKYAAAIADCIADGDLDKVYTPGALKKALAKMPTDVGAYTACPDVLRFARSAGPVVPVTKKGARLRARCVDAAYKVTLSVGETTLGSTTVPACKGGRTKIVRVPLTAPGTATKGARKKKLVTIVAEPAGMKLQFVARLTGRKVS